ncbi:hypothetical protein [Vibrio phage vB_VpaP_C2]|nr:hypothetical protein [Vibrio phage vB_VpaP_C2]
MANNWGDKPLFAFLASETPDLNFSTIRIQNG